MYSKGKIKEFKKIKTFLNKEGIDIFPIKLYTEDDDVDVVLRDKEKYKQAIEILKQNGFRDLLNLSRYREILKRQYISDDYKYILHLHSTISWNGIEYVNPKKVVSRLRPYEDIMIPSPEDEMLIIGAHSITENKRIVFEERMYYRFLLKNFDIDWDYIDSSVRNYNWQKAWAYFQAELESNHNLFSIARLIVVSFDKFFKDLPANSIRHTFWQFFSYTFIDYIWCYRNAIRKVRKKNIIAFVGLDGSGKTTQSKFVVDFFREAFGLKVVYRHVLKKSSSVKVGDLSKKTGLLNLLSNNSLFSFARKTFAIIDILLFRINIIFNINRIFVCDRYFYDVLVHIRYFHGQDKNFEKFYKKLIPKKIIFFLDVSIDEAMNRKEEHSLDRMKKKKDLYENMKNEFIVIGQNSQENVNEDIKEKLLDILM